MATPLTVDAGETLPHGADAHETAQLTPWLLLSFTRVAVSWALWVPTTVGVAGATAIPIDGTSSVAEADFVLSVADAPVAVTVISLAGGVVGAV